MKSVFLAIIFFAAEISMAGSLKVGAGFPDFSLEKMKGGGSVKLADLVKGKKAVLVDFWASWCEPCKISFPELDGLQKQFGGKGLQVVGVNVDEKSADGMKFLSEKPVSFLILHDSGQKLAKQVDLSTMPTSFLIDAKGKIRLVHRGFRKPDVDKYKKEITKLLK